MLNLFRCKSKRKKLYHIEINDEAIDAGISKLIIEVNDQVREFKKTINEIIISAREEKLQNLYTLMLDIKGKIEQLEVDVKTINGIKFNNQDYFIIKDQKFFIDKKVQLQKIRESMTEFITIVEQKPSTQELKEELLDKLIAALNHIIESIKYVIADDKNLREIYKKITDV